MTLNALLWGTVIYVVPGLFVAKKVFRTKPAQEAVEDVKPHGPGYVFLMWLIVVLVWLPCILYGLWNGLRQLRIEMRKTAVLKAYTKKIDAMVHAVNSVSMAMKSLTVAIDANDPAKQHAAVEALLAWKLELAQRLCAILDSSCSDCGGPATGILWQYEAAVVCRICSRLRSYEDAKILVLAKLKSLGEA